MIFFGRNGNEIEPFIGNELDMKDLRNCLRERRFIYLRLTFQSDRFGVKRLVKRDSISCQLVFVWVKLDEKRARQLRWTEPVQ